MRHVAFFAFRLVFGSPENRRRVLPIVVGMALAIVPLLVVQMAAVGIIMGISARYIETDSFHLRAEATQKMDRSVVDRIRSSLEAVSPLMAVYEEWEGQGIIIGREKRSPVTIRAVDKNLWSEDERFSHYMSVVQGTPVLSHSKDILLGSEIAKTIGAQVGDEVTLLTVNIWQKTVLPRLSKLQVAGIVSSGYQEMDRFWTFISLDTAQQVLPPDGSRQFLKMKVATPYAIANDLLPQLLPLPGKIIERRNMHSLITRLREELGTEWQLHTWYQLGIQQFDRFRITQQLMLLLMVLVLCVGSIIVSVFISRLIVEQSRSIAMLKALGASPSLMFQILLMIGSIIGLTASVLGVSFSILTILSINDIISVIDWVMNTTTTFLGKVLDISIPSVSLLSSELYLERIPVQLQFFPLLIVAVGEIVVSTLAGILPARASFHIRPSGIILRGL